MSDTTKNTKHYRGVEYRLLPGSRSKARKLAGLSGACRFVWNAILAQIRDEYKQAKEAGENGPSTSFFSLGPRFTKLRHEVDWLPQYSFAIVRHTLKDQSQAWKAFFQGDRDRPDWHKRHTHTPSFTIPENVKLRDGKIQIPKIGWMEFRRKGGNPYPDGKPVEATVRKEGRYWKLSVTYEIDAPDFTENGIAVGIDANTNNIAWTDTRGEQGMLEIPKLAKEEIKIKRYQRKLAQQQNGSGRRAVTKRKIAKWKRKQKNQRKNRAHQNSRILANRAETLIRENLKLKNMTKSAKGTAEDPGTNVKAKSGLNRVMLNASHGRFNTYCEYKFKTVIAVDPKYTSQTCNTCGWVDKGNRLSQSKFECVSCGHADHADLNASANILASGIGATGLGRSVSVRNSYDPSNGRVQFAV